MRRVLGLVALGAAVATGCTSGGPAAGSTPSHTAVSATAATPRPTPAPTATATVNATCGWKSSPVYRHVIWIWMENRSYSAVLGSGAGAPHLRSYAARCGLATSYAAVAHPSLPNYLAASSGSAGGVTTDCSPSTCPQNRPSLFTQLQDAGRQWRGYAESMPGNCVLVGSGRYAPRHNPAVYFTPVRPRCRTWDVPMGGSTGAFATALAHHSLAPFSFVTPDLCSDGHDCSTSTADAWLGTWLGRITRSAAYRAGDTVVFLTWDEGVGADQRVATLVIAPTVPKGSRVTTPFTHYSLLRTTEELLGLRRLGAAAGARSMKAAFHL